ncbi:sugar phosphate isomerase/epimerase family protein [Corynebacterium sp. A21]|uniref:sugar phosphate isomerase/epimerase family protein n=1 Tax=Corynebacterium sp. A21 TaxID=3457318 RepID=UPI003FCFD685
MTHSLYAMDTFFSNSMGTYDFETRAQILQQLGYDATYLSLFGPQGWAEAERLTEVKQYGIDVAAVFVPVDLSQGTQSPQAQRVLNLLERLEGTDTVELPILSVGRQYPRSAAAGDAVAIDFLQQALAIAERRGIQLLLYPHYSYWMEQHNDAVRLCQQLNHPNLGIVFCGPHWYLTGGRNLDRDLAAMAPYLRQANLSGLIKDPHGWAGVARVQLIDEGELDNFIVLGALKRAGFEGRIGFQGWDLGGDAYHNLEHSLRSFRDMEQRVNKHPHWAVLKTGR